MIARVTHLPTGLKPYRRTDSFTADTVPAGLLRDHKTKAGIWGLIHVVRGWVSYRVAGTETTLTPGINGVIEPEMLHSVSLPDDAEFFVEFWR